MLSFFRGISARLGIIACLSLFLLFVSAAAPIPSSAALLPAPSALRVTANTWNQFKVEWVAVPGATGYWLQRRMDGGTTFDSLVMPPATQTSFLDTVQNGHLYTYRIQAIGGSEPGLATDSAPASMLWPTQISLLSVAADKVEVSWTLPANPWLPASGYTPVIERRLNADAWILAGRAAAGSATFTDSGLAEGSRYEYRVRFDVGLDGNPLWYPTTGGQVLYTKLRAPTSLTAALTTYGTVEIAWKTDAVQAGNTQIERSSDGGPFVLLATVAAGTISYSDGSVSNGHVYRYRVRHVGVGSNGDWSPEGRIVLVYPNYMSTEAVYPDQINLAWTWPTADQAVLGEAKPRIERRMAGENTWTQLVTLEPGVTGYRDQGLTPDTVYNYRIQAQFQDDSLSPWYPASGQGREARTGIAFGTGFSGHALSATMVRLEWDYEALGGKTAILERYDSAGVPQPVLTTSSESSFIESGLLPGTDYTWRLTVRAPSGFSTTSSDPLTIKTEAAPTPANVKATPAAADRIVISWQYDFTQESGFEVWRKTSGTWTRVGETGRNIQYWTDTALPASGRAQWKVRAVRGANVYSAFALTESRTLDTPVLPQEFDALMTLGRLALSWASPLPDLGADVTYHVEGRSGLNGDWREITAVPAGRRSIDWFLMDSGEMQYRIRADVKGLALYSAIYLFPGREPGPVTGLKAVSVGPGRVQLSWDEPDTAVSGYRIFRLDGGIRRQIGTVSGTMYAYSDTTAASGTKPSYAVHAWNAYTISPEATLGPLTVPAVLSFSDLSNYGWAASSVNRLVSLGIVTGTSASRFSPARGLVRAEYMKMLLTTLGIPESRRPAGPVADVPADAWYAGWMYAALEHGILQPDASGRLFPAAPVTRGEMAFYTQNACLVAGKAMVPADESVLDAFTDQADIPDAQRGAMVMMVGSKLIAGHSNGRLAPRSVLNRAEAAVVLVKLLGLKGS